MSMSDEELMVIGARLNAASRGPWRPMIESRDHLAGDDFTMIGDGPRWADDTYVPRETVPRTERTSPSQCTLAKK
jgi:hypothetical protein